MIESKLSGKKVWSEEDGQSYSSVENARRSLEKEKKNTNKFGVEPD